VIARFAKESGAIVIAAVTLPFKLEGARIVKAEEGMEELRKNCDTVIVIENQRLLELARNLPLKKAFGIADDLIASMIKGITETIYEPSLVNLDYADVKAVMRYGGVAAIGVGVAEHSMDEDRAESAIQKAMNNPLLNVDYKGAKGALIHVTGGHDLKLEEVNRIGNYVQSQLDPDAQVIWGARILPEFANKLQVITIVTGVKSPYILGPAPKQKGRDVSKELGIEMIRKK
jgi:cell division protein FtsZ